LLPGFKQQSNAIRPQPLHELLAKVPPDISAGGLLVRTILWHLAVWTRTETLPWRARSATSVTRADNSIGEQAFLNRTRHHPERRLPRFLLLMEYEEYHEDLRELIAGDPLSEHRGKEEIEGIAASHYERDNLFLLFEMNKKIEGKRLTLRLWKRGRMSEKHGVDAAGRSVFNLVPYKDEGGREYISRFLYAELHPIRMLMRSKGLNLMGFADKMGISRCKIPLSFLTDSIMKPWNLAKMKKHWPEIDLKKIRQDFFIWKATDFAADPVLFAATAMQVFVEHEKELKAKKKTKRR